jgi:hypothetical protein
MNHNLVIDSIVISPILPAFGLALLLTCLTSMVLIRLRLYRWLWRRPLAEAAIFCIWLGVISVASPLPGFS